MVDPVKLKDGPCDLISSALHPYIIWHGLALALVPSGRFTITYIISVRNVIVCMRMPTLMHNGVIVTEIIVSSEDFCSTFDAVQNLTQAKSRGT